MFSFIVTKLGCSNIGPRLGQVFCQSRAIINTPHYAVSTSRGVLPHVSHDVLVKHTAVSAAYIALEDFIEKSAQEAPIFRTPSDANESALRKYTALPEKCLSILGSRRIPSIPCPAHNTNSSISVSTSVGFRFLELEDYIQATQVLKPDVSVSMADLVDAEKISSKRIEKSADRTHAWLRDTLGTEVNGEERRPATFAVIPSIEQERQSFYLADLEDEYKSQVKGLCIYDPISTNAIPNSLLYLPRICLTDPATPHAILEAISSGVDIITIPFTTKASEHGISLDFRFALSDQNGKSEPLGLDLWSREHATSLNPLTSDCKCYTCTRHHRAYVHHLLQAKEMLAWTLLQIHNLAVIDRFFQDIRESISAGKFEEDVAKFNRAYESEMPEQTGQGPRVRGYQMKSMGGGEPKRNPKAYGRLDDTVEKYGEAEEGVAMPDVDSEELVHQGFAEKSE